MQTKKEALYTALPRLPEQLLSIAIPYSFNFWAASLLTAFGTWICIVTYWSPFTEGFCMEGTPFPLSLIFPPH